VTGADISEAMLAQARRQDPRGRYHLVAEGDTGWLAVGVHDLVLSAFTFDNIPTMEKKVTLFEALRRSLAPHGRIVNLVSSPDIYVHEWASFSTRDFPENRTAKSGDRVRIVMLDVKDRRPVEDILWTDDAYHETYARAGLQAVETRRPLAKPGERFSWVSETTTAPWVIYVLAASAGG
jgi:ubiquinone/menaquinone biosynthesis C-methylase UbiE